MVISATIAPPKPFGSNTRTIPCSAVVLYKERVLTERAYAELATKLRIEAAGSVIEDLELYSDIKPCTIHYRAGDLNVVSEKDPQGSEVFSLVDQMNNTLLYFTPLD